MNQIANPVRRAIPAGAVESRWCAADGMAIRRIDWPVLSQSKGAILFLPGRGDFYEKYLEALDYWHGAGWNVTASDWRGQGASGRLGSDHVTGHIDDFATWIGDLEVLWGQWRTEATGPHVLIAHSMGGHLALRAVAEGRIAPDGLILAAPMLGFRGRFLPAIAMHAMARLAAAVGDPRRPAWKWSEKPGQVPEGRGAILTHDPERYADELWWREARPELVMGPGSWGWVERAYSSMRGLFRPGVLERVEVPVLILATDNDRLVSYRAVERAAERLGNVRLVNFGEAAHHEILREADPVRARALAECDAFLAQVVARP